ncbi:MAG: FGGY family carbohydrate kinase [Roseiarcus sp.]|jgi:sugar (pentulose or hexulose) kinase
MPQSAVVVLDIGKTNAKLVAIGEGRVLMELETPNRSFEGPPYLHFDVDGLWNWVRGGLREIAPRFVVEAIVPCTHGSGIAVTDDRTLVLPVMDYTAEPPAEIRAAYLQIAPSFAECGCSTGPVSVTSAVQLFWQSRAFPKLFGKATRIMTLAQYWAWRLSGVAASEITQLGAQTHLWNPVAQRFSSLAEAQGWARLFPPLRHSWERLGPIELDLARSCGLPTDCPVLCGIHDSSASYLAYLRGGLERDAVVSTGTWIIGFNPLQPIDRLAPDRDTVSNSTVFGKPLASSRYMGGEEYARLAGKPAATATVEAAAAVIAAGTLALPSFVNWGGPYIGCRGRLEGPPPSGDNARAALAAIYTALVTNTCLDLLESREGIVLEGHFAGNEVYRRVLAALRPDQALRVATSPAGSALGASLLHRWEDAKPSIALAPVLAAEIPELASYALRWRQLAEQEFATRKL